MGPGCLTEAVEVAGEVEPEKGLGHSHCSESEAAVKPHQKGEGRRRGVGRIGLLTMAVLNMARRAAPARQAGGRPLRPPVSALPGA